ncbi:MAG: GDP-mannose-dependent alpha-(1-2)-phosphatidylinositol mannosyltransferase [Acidobacteriota bacterium]|jgi:glycosyltransferase involved in cell wall biosynthesis
MLAPEPFFEPRGTPFSEYHRIKALGELGHHVDLITYPIGRDVELPNLRIYRSLRPPFVTKVRIGPSFTKIVLDGLMLLTIARHALTKKYDAIHSHEEMGLVGVWLAKLLGIPHLYDMHSSLPQQLSNFKYSKSAALRGVFNWMEDQMVHKSDVVITICQELQDTVTEMGVADRSLLIENVMGGDVDEPPSRSPGEVRSAWGVPADAPLALYTGTFEAYQGVDMLIDAVALIARRRPDARVLVVGGEPAQVERAKARAAAAGAAGSMIFTGQQPAREIPGFVQAADLLVSPRIRGTNTPLKIYSYLRSGKPIIATNLLTHTQVLSPEFSKLVDPTPERFAEAILDLLDRPDERARLSSAAAAIAQEKYSRESYLRRTAEAYRRLASGTPAASKELARQ